MGIDAYINAGKGLKAEDIEKEVKARGESGLYDVLPAMAYLAIKSPGELPEMETFLKETVGEIAAGLKTNQRGGEDVTVFVEREPARTKKDGKEGLAIFSRFTEIGENLTEKGEMLVARYNKARSRWEDGMKATGKEEDKLPLASECIAMAIGMDYDTDEVEIEPSEWIAALAVLSGAIISEAQYAVKCGRFDLNASRRGNYSPTKMLTDHHTSIFRLEADEKFRTPESVDMTKFQDMPGFVRKFEDFSDREKALIPKDENYIPDSYDVFIFNEFLRTSSKDFAQMTRNILWSGPSGIGKSARARNVARVLRRPYRSETCSASTSEDNIFGLLLPVVEDGEEKALGLTDEERKIYDAIKSSDQDRFSITDAVADALGLPTLATCYLSPTDAAAELGGTASDPSDAAELLDGIVGAKIASVVSKVKNSGKEGVRYQYIPSAIVTAVKEGYVLEIQEPTNVQQQAVFSCLYDVLERASIGTLQTPLGPIKRHDDFICIVTTNHGYVGNRPLAVPFESRMQLSIDFDAPGKEVLCQRVLAKTGKDVSKTADAMKVVDVYHAALEMTKELGCKGEPTPRALYTFADACFDGVDPLMAFKSYVLSFCSHEAEDRDAIMEAIEDLPLMTQGI